MKIQNHNINHAKKYLQVSSVNKSFGDVTVLHDINLECVKGELICLLGPSGCGKTTLLRIIAGLETKGAGKLVQDGVDISNLSAENRDFGIVFQSYALFPNLTVKKNIAYGLRKQPKSAVKQRVNELLEMVGLAEHGKKYPTQLSGGQQQRVALARALAISPGLLLLDEPLSALDAKVRVRLRQEIKSLQRRLGITTIMVTHDQDEAMSMADRIVVMNEGYIEQVGTPHEIYTEPATPFVASFVGAMNFIPAYVNAMGEVSSAGATIKCKLPDWVQLPQELELGVRPEHFKVQPYSGVEDGIVARIDKVEFLGAFVRLHTAVQSDEDDGHAAYPETVLVDVSSEQHIEHRYHMDMRVVMLPRKKRVTVYDTERNL